MCIHFVSVCVCVRTVKYAGLLAPEQSHHNRRPQTGITNFQKIKIPFIFIWLSALKFVERRKSSSFIYKIHIIARLAARFTAPWALPSCEVAPLAGVQFSTRLRGPQSQSARSER